MSSIRKSLSQEKSTRPSHHANEAAKAFKNPWPSATVPTRAELNSHSFPLSWYTGRNLKNQPDARDVKVVKPDWGASLRDANKDHKANGVIGTWLGHATVLVELPLKVDSGSKSCWLLFDPIFSARAGPNGYIGPRRTKNPPCQVDDLPGCDAVFISHNHYDHLDLASILAVQKKFPRARYFVPLGNKNWFVDSGIQTSLVFELDWWQNREFSPEDLGHSTVSTSSTDTLLRITSVPAQHNSGRTGTDSGNTLWCGWTVEQFINSRDEAAESERIRNCAIFHAGDTGYRRTAKSDVKCPAFKEIGDKFGPFDMSFIPIWRGGTLGFISYFGIRLSHEDIPSALHATPADAVDIHLDVKSKNSIAVHFGTFVGSENETYEASLEFAEACRNKRVAPLQGSQDDEVSGFGRAGIVDIGESFMVEI